MAAQLARFLAVKRNYGTTGYGMVRAKVVSMANDVLISGNTFPVKDQLRALGGRWDAAAKGWRVPDLGYDMDYFDTPNGE